MHEDVEAHRNAVGSDSEFGQGGRQVAKAPLMRIGMTIQLAKHFRAARAQEKVVPSYRVFHHFKHHVAAVRIKRMARGQEDGAGIVHGAPRR